MNFERAPSKGSLGLPSVRLQTLHLNTIAEQHIYKSMMKAKALTSSTAFPLYIKAEVEAIIPSRDAAQVNVQARLFNSNPVKIAMTDIMARIGAVLGIDNNEFLRIKKRLRADDFVGGNDAVKRPTEEKKTTSALMTEVVGTETVQSVLPQMGDSQATKENIESNNEISDYDKYASRLADSSDDEYVNGEDLHESWNGIPKSRSPKNPSLSLSSDLSPSPNQELPNSHPQKASTALTKTTTFLPSLTMGGYISDSDSTNFSDTHLDTANAKVRKNRRGQQERRQIWEKKYGRNANHLKSQIKSQRRDLGWESRVGDQKDRTRNWRGKKMQDRKSSRDQQRGGGPTTSGANSDPVDVRARPNKKTEKNILEERPLHPSWEAAKKAKEAKKAITFQGKKVVFD